MITVSQAGVFYPNSQVSQNQITDGTSHTIMLGELQRLHNPGYVPAGQNAEYYGPDLTSADGWAVGGLSTLFDCNTVGNVGGFDDYGQPGGFNNNFFESAGSMHPGGANFTAVNGAVHFLNENMDSTVYAMLGSMADGGIFDPSVPKDQQVIQIIQFPDQ